MLYANVDKGKIHFSRLGADKKIGSFGPKDLDKLVAFFIERVKEGWDGHIMTSSSLNWSREYGWPKDTAHEFIEEAINEMDRRAEEILKKREEATKLGSDE